jgi:aryl-alcohol dehydrogenase-like predicted oxidoreductase
MKSDYSRRSFLAAGLALPAVGIGVAAPQQNKSTAGKLDYRILGKTGLKVSTVGYGCMITSDATVITRALDMGINYFDTSRNYQNGQNERMVAAALGSKRKNIILSSKCDTKTDAGILAELETSLKELNTDYLDIWYLHGLGTAAAISDELVEAQKKAKQQGKVRFIGVSTHSLPAVADRALEARLDVVLAQYNFTSPPEYTWAVEKLHNAGVGMVAMKVMARAGRRGGGDPLPAGRPAAALKWVIKNPSISTTIPSMTDVDQLEQNFAVMGQSFTDTDAKVLTAALDDVGPYFCRMCGKCDGQCPKGLPARELVRFAMYADGYGQFALGRENFLRLTAEHQAIRCGDCDSCPVRCPNGVRIAEQARRAQELFA